MKNIDHLGKRWVNALFTHTWMPTQTTQLSTDRIQSTSLSLDSTKYILVPKLIQQATVMSRIDRQFSVLAFLLWPVICLTLVDIDNYQDPWGLIQMTVPAELKRGSVPMTDASTNTEDDLGMPLSTLYSRK